MKNLIITLAFIATTSLCAAQQEVIGIMNWAGEMEAPASSKSFDLPRQEGSFVPSSFVTCTGPLLTSVSVSYSVVKTGRSIKINVKSLSINHNNTLYYNHKGQKNIDIKDFESYAKITTLTAKALLSANGKTHEISLSLDEGSSQEIGNYCDFIGICNNIDNLKITILNITYFKTNINELTDDFKTYFLKNIY